MLSYCLNTTNMEWRKVVVDHHVMIIIAFVLWGDETYNNQPQKLQHTNKQYWYIMWSVEQLYNAASMIRVGIYRKNMRVQCRMKRGQLYPMKRGVIITFGCEYYVSKYVSCLLLKWKLFGRGHHN